MRNLSIFSGGLLLRRLLIFGKNVSALRWFIFFSWFVQNLSVCLRNSVWTVSFTDFRARENSFVMGLFNVESAILKEFRRVMRRDFFLEAFDFRE